MERVYLLNKAGAGRVRDPTGALNALCFGRICGAYRQGCRSRCEKGTLFARVGLGSLLGSRGEAL